MREGGINKGSLTLEVLAFYLMNANKVRLVWNVLSMKPNVCTLADYDGTDFSLAYN